MKKYILLLAFLCIHISLSYAEVLTENDTIINNVRYKLIKNEGYAPYYVVEGLKDCEQITSPLIINSITFTGIEIPVKVISKDAFKQKSFTNITIPYGIEFINEAAFEHCYSLETVSLPTSLKSISGYAFAYCPKLQNVYISNKNTSISNSAFKYSNLPSAFHATSTTPTQTTIHYQVDGTILRNGCYIFPHSSDYYTGNEATFLHGSFSKTVTGLKPNNEYFRDYGYILSEGRIYSGKFSIGKTKGFNPTITEIESYPGCIFRISYTKDDAVTDLKVFWGYRFYFPGDRTTIFEKKIGERSFDCDNDTIIFEEEDIDRSKCPGLITDFYVKCYTNNRESCVKTFEHFPNLVIKTIKEASALSNTVAIVCAEINLHSATTAGFEWRRYDAPELVPNNKANCPIVDGMMMGALKNLSPNTYYKFRPYYVDRKGKEHFGEWSAFGTSDAYVYFEPTVRTSTISDIEDTRAEVRGFAIAGSDPIIEQGFEYWESDNTNSTPMYNLFSVNNKQIVNSEGQWMSATLENLNSNATYTVRAFVKTEKGTTYGEQQTFTTTSLSGNKNILRSSEDISIKLIGQERNCIKLHIEGLNNEGKYQIYSINGTLVCSGTLDCTETAHIINIPNLTSGMYLLKVISNKQCKTLRFVTK